MEERTAEEVAAIFAAAGDSVTVINTDKTEDETAEDYKDSIQRNVDHLELIKAYKKVDETTSNQSKTKLKTLASRNTKTWKELKRLTLYSFLFRLKVHF